jgi:hypothetical protein
MILSTAPPLPLPGGGKPYIEKESTHMGQTTEQQTTEQRTIGALLRFLRDRRAEYRLARRACARYIAAATIEEGEEAALEILAAGRRRASGYPLFEPLPGPPEVRRGL